MCPSGWADAAGVRGHPRLVKKKAQGSNVWAKKADDHGRASDGREDPVGRPANAVNTKGLKMPVHYGFSAGLWHSTIYAVWQTRLTLAALPPIFMRIT